jgi:hypothetical protein
MMSASDNLNPNQLAMFMPAHKLYNMPSLDAAATGFDVEAMRHEKRIDNRDEGMRHSLIKEGVRNPIQIAHATEEPQDWDWYMNGHQSAIANGNHRVIGAYDLNPDMEIPVIHHDNVDDMREHQKPQDRDN